jgi:hypothetical protein
MGGVAINNSISLDGVFRQSSTIYLTYHKSMFSLLNTWF